MRQILSSKLFWTRILGIFFVFYTVIGLLVLFKQESLISSWCGLFLGFFIGRLHFSYQRYKSIG